MKSKWVSGNVAAVPAAAFCCPSERALPLVLRVNGRRKFHAISCCNCYIKGTYTDVCNFVCVCGWLDVCKYVCIAVCALVNIIFVYICVCVNVLVCAHIHLYMQQITGIFSSCHTHTSRFPLIRLLRLLHLKCLQQF